MVSTGGGAPYLGGASLISVGEAVGGAVEAVWQPVKLAVQAIANNPKTAASRERLNFESNEARRCIAEPSMDGEDTIDVRELSECISKKDFFLGIGGLHRSTEARLPAAEPSEIGLDWMDWIDDQSGKAIVSTP